MDYDDVTNSRASSLIIAVGGAGVQRIFAHEPNDEKTTESHPRQSPLHKIVKLVCYHALSRPQFRRESPQIIFFSKKRCCEEGFSKYPKLRTIYFLNEHASDLGMNG